MKINKDGLDLIKSFEGCKLSAYRDVVGILTIGWGYTGPEVKDGLTWTQDQADKKLLEKLELFERSIDSLVKVPLNENEFSALVCFIYNIGSGAFSKSTMLKLINAGKKDLAANEFLKWNKAGGKEVKGLTRRREAEKSLFLRPAVAATPAAKKSLLPDVPSDEDINKILEEVENKVKGK